MCKNIFEEKEKEIYLFIFTNIMNFKFISIRLQSEMYDHESLHGSSCFMFYFPVCQLHYMTFFVDKGFLNINNIKKDRILK